MRLTWLVAAAVAAVYVERRARELAERDGRPLTEVLAGLPQRIADDLATLPEDLRMAVGEGRLAADRRRHELDELIRMVDEQPSDGGAHSGA